MAGLTCSPLSSSSCCHGRKRGFLLSSWRSLKGRKNQQWWRKWLGETNFKEETRRRSSWKPRDLEHKGRESWGGGGGESKWLTFGRLNPNGYKYIHAWRQISLGRLVEDPWTVFFSFFKGDKTHQTKNAPLFSLGKQEAFICLPFHLDS